MDFSYSTAKRYIPILPSLPNGLKDTYTSTCKSSIPVDPRAKGADHQLESLSYNRTHTILTVDTLLNPCFCKDVWNCRCDVTTHSSGSTRESALSTLARAAASLPRGTDIPPDTQCDYVSHPEISLSTIPQKHPRDCCHATTKSRSSSPKRPFRRTHSPSPRPSKQRGPLLPPILYSSSSEPSSSTPPPLFPSIPPISGINAIAGSGCTCGYDCNCPGCVEHRGPEHISEDHSDCPDSCGTCVDNEHGIELPTSSPFGTAYASKPTLSVLDAFFARAATIPPPPPERAFALIIDPRNFTVYPSTLFSGPANLLEQRGPAFGLVRLPKLECCAGRCGCPGDTCGCGQNCDGCCASHEGDRRRDTVLSSSCATSDQATPHDAGQVPCEPLEEIRSCCTK